jgi:hypothetical protein
MNEPDDGLLDPIRQLLQEPSAVVPLAELAWHFEIGRLTYVFERPRHIDDGVRLPAALRGALGNQLAKVSAAASSMNGRAAYPSLFGDFPNLYPSRHFPRPMVIWCATDRAALRVDITLFGNAMRWRDDVHAAMKGVMTPRENGGQGGVTLDGVSAVRRIWALRACSWRQRSAIPMPPAKRSFLMTTKTPLVAGNDGVLKGGDDALFLSLFVRLQGMAAWNGLRVAEFDGIPATRAMAACVRVGMRTNPKPAMFSRRSKSFGASTKHEDGLLTSMLVNDYPETLWPAFVLGAYTHFGSSATQGAGRYVISDP